MSPTEAVAGEVKDTTWVVLSGGVDGAWQQHESTLEAPSRRLAVAAAQELVADKCAEAVSVVPARSWSPVIEVEVTKPTSRLEDFDPFAGGA